MHTAIKNFLPKGIISLLFLWFFIIGGCDIEFGSDDSGGGGGGGSDIETVQGTIVETIPDQGIEGILVEITLNGFLEGSDTTGSSGIFDIEGRFAGSPKIEFFDEESVLLGAVFITVFPTAKVELGDIRLENGTVIFEDGNAEVTFDSKVTVNNCTGNSGSLEVKAENDQEEIDVIVQISDSTDLEKDGDDITCDDIFVGNKVEIEGELLSGNSVDASRVEVN